MGLKDLTISNFDEETSKGLVLVDFWAEWCGPCKALTPVLEEISQDSSLPLRIGKVDVDNNRDLAMRFNVRSIPTLIYFKDGRPIEQSMGLQSKEQLLAKVRQLAG